MALRIPSPVALTKPEAYLAYKAGILSRGELKDKLLNPINNYEGWLAKWCELLETYPTNEDGTPQCLTDEEGLLAYLCGVTNRYPVSNSNPDDARVSAYIRYLISARYARPDHPLNREEFYLSLIKTQFIPSGDPSSDIVIDGTTKAPFLDVKMFGNATQTTYSGKNLFSGDFSQFDNQGGTGSTYVYFKLPTDGVYTLSLKAKNNVPAQSSGKFLGFTSTGSNTSSPIRWVWGGNSSATAGQTLSGNNTTAETGNMGFFSLYPANATTLQWFVDNFEIQLEAGSTATDYEPYVGGIPAPNPEFPQPISTVTGEQTVKVVGKNLLTFDGMEWNSPALDISEVGSNSVTLVPNASSAAYANKNVIYKFKDLGLKAGDTITISADITGTYATDTSNPRIRIYGKDASSAIAAALSPSDNIRTLTIPDDTDQIMLYFYIRDGQTPTSGSYATFSNIQLELGSTATAYEPYQGQEFPIDLASKNVFNPDILPATWTNTSAVYVPLNLKPNTTYTMSSNIPRASGNALIFFLESGQAIGTNTNGVWEGQTRTLTTDASGNNLRIVYRSFQGETRTRDDYQFQLEEGSSASEYEAYYSLELAKIGTYQDRIYKNDGKWYVEKQVGKVVLDGSENWIGAGSSFYIDSVTDYLKTGNKPFCDYFTTTTNVPSAGSVSDDTLAFGAPNLSVPRLYVKYTSIFSSVSDLTTWLASHPTTVYYALATPTTTEITDQTLIDQLNALKQGGAEDGTTYIKVSATDPNLPAKLYVEAPKYD